MRKHAIRRMKQLELTEKQKLVYSYEPYATFQSHNEKVEQVRKEIYGVSEFPVSLVQATLQAANEAEERVYLFGQPTDIPIRENEDIEDAILAEHSRTNKKAFLRLVNLYTPFMWDLIYKPFEPILSHGIGYFIGMQQSLDAYFANSHIRKALVAEDLKGEVLLKFIECVKRYEPLKGTFRGYIKNYLPYGLKGTYEEILERYKNETSYDELVAMNSKKLLGLPKPENKGVAEKKIDQLCQQYRLTDKQSEVAHMLAFDTKHKFIAEHLGITRQGVERHIEIIRTKMKKFMEKYQ